MSTTPEAHRVRPLSGAACWILTLSTAATIGLFYLFVCATVLLGFAWLGFVLIVFVILLRFGLSGLISKYLEREVQHLLLLARALWLRESAEYQLPLSRAEAPRLFAMLDRLAGRMQIPPPNELCLELSCGAWVQLRGLRTGLGLTRVGIGYDLLAGLTEQEVEAVMAHELAHAKLIGRFFNNRLSAGLRRSVAVTSQLANFVDAHRRANESAGLASLILPIADQLTALCARQMSAYSRQGEFEADQGAATLCGAAPLRSSLQKLPTLHRKLNRLPWNERVAKIESPEGLARWLLSELGTVTALEEENGDEPFDRYSTHPPLPDRLAALPNDGSVLTTSPAGLGLLADADATALKLVGAIEQIAVQEETKDLTALRKWLSQIRRSGPTHIRFVQLPAILVVMAGFVFGIALMAAPAGLIPAILLWLISLALGVWLYRLGFYRDSLTLPVPAFSTFILARQNFPLPNIEAEQSRIEQELRTLIAGEPKKKRKAARLVEAAYADLGRGDYLRAHVAARIAEEFRKDWVPRQLAMMVAAAAFDQKDTVQALFQAVLKSTGFRSPSTLLAAGWTLLLGWDWFEAEALLRELDRRKPGSADIESLLALCATRRGKLRTATRVLRAVCTPRAPSREHLKLLVDLLLSTGALHEAGPRLEEFPADSAKDPDVIYYRTQCHLLRREFDRAEEQLAGLDETKLSAGRLLGIGYLYENARADDKARHFFELASARGHCPEALLALSSQALDSGDRERARVYLHQAFDTTQPLAEGGTGIFSLLPRALAQLYNLEPLRDDCRAWVTKARADKEPASATKHEWIVFAPDERSAATYYLTLLHLLTPNEPPLPIGLINVLAAPVDLQPKRPVHPGMQYIYK